MKQEREKNVLQILECISAAITELGSGWWWFAVAVVFADVIAVVFFDLNCLSHREGLVARIRSKISSALRALSQRLRPAARDSQDTEAWGLVAHTDDTNSPNSSNSSNSPNSPSLSHTAPSGGEGGLQRKATEAQGHRLGSASDLGGLGAGVAAANRLGGVK